MDYLSGPQCLDGVGHFIWCCKWLWFIWILLTCHTRVFPQHEWQRLSMRRFVTRNSHSSQNSYQHDNFTHGDKDYPTIKETRDLKTQITTHDKYIPHQIHIKISHLTSSRNQQQKISIKIRCIHLAGIDMT